MILRMNADTSLALYEPLDFTRLHCEIALSSSQEQVVRARLEGVAELRNVDTVWIDVAWLRAQVRTASSSEPDAFDRMIASARPHGWVSPDGLRVKAHVIWAAATTLEH